MRASKGEKIFFAINYIILSLLGLSCFLPFLNTVAISLSDSKAVISGLVSIWPIGWTHSAYVALMNGTNILQALQNSIVITVVGVGLSMIFTILAAYPLSRPYFYCRRFFTLAIVFTMLFNGGLIPLYLLIKSLGLINSYGSLWLPALVNTFNMLVMRTFFENIPAELEEAARMDGCGEWRYLLRIMLPLSMPVIATLALFYAVSYWNYFFSVLIYINDTSKYNLTVLVQQMIQSQELMRELNSFQSQDQMQSLSPDTIKAAGVVVMTIPMLVVYPFLQKYFVKGVMIGAIKG